MNGNAVAWARVSSREQKEGCSLDAQLRAVRDKAKREGLKIVKEFSVAESAKRGADREEFNRMLAWVRANAKRENITVILAHKLDRACRNMRDAVRLQDLEDSCGVRPLFVDNQFGQGAAGQLSFNVMAAVAQYYSENLRGEVLKGMNEKVEQGWLPANAPFGYYNDTPDRNEPIKPEPAKSKTVIRMFGLYAAGDMTFDALADKLLAEGHTYSTSQPKFARTVLAYILHNRFYVGEIVWHGRVFAGKHKALVPRPTFEAVQDLLRGKNRRVGHSNLPLARGLFRCAYCGRGVTSEVIHRRLRDGSTRQHVYYRCSNNHPGPDHPTVRWRADNLENAVLGELDKLKLPSDEVTDWFRKGLRKALSDEVEFNKQRKAQLHKREAELQGRQARLLDTFLAGSVEKTLYEKMASEVRLNLDRIRGDLKQEAQVNTAFVDMAEAVFNLTQQAPETWRGSNAAVRRELLTVLSLNRTLSDTTLRLEWSKPFDAVAEGHNFQESTGGWI